jgi:CubicO group peptidase (beta-lactamase class C family)
VVDELTPNEQFGSQVFNDTPLPSRSIGKSLTSYLLGHAICEGFIDDVAAKLDDWDWIADTVYEGQALIDLLNMRAGDQAYAHTNRLFLPNNQDRNIRWKPLSLTLNQLKGTKPDERHYNYNDLAVNTVTNYIRHKTGNNYRQFTANFLHNKVGIASQFYFMAVDSMRVEPYGEKGTGATISNFSASRYDFLRIARAMLNDWQNDTCEGKYLKTIFERRMPKDRPDKNFQRGLKEAKSPNKSFNSYGGYFHMGLTKTDKRRHIIGMDGFGGQMIWIDFDEGRIVVTNAIYNNYNWKNIVRDVIRKGKISSGNWN